MHHVRHAQGPTLSAGRKRNAGSGSLQAAANNSHRVHQLKVLQSLADLRVADAGKAAAPSAAPIQARMLRDIPKGASGWSDRATLGPGVAGNIKQFIWGKVAGFPNQTIRELLGDLKTEAWGNKHQEDRVDNAVTALEDLSDQIADHSWDWLTAQWVNLDDRIEKLYMEVYKSKATISGGIEISVSRGFGDKIGEAAKGETTEDWRKRGAYGGIGSRLPKSKQHYVVGHGTTRYNAGAERVYTTPAKTEPGHEGIEAYYSPTHGDSRAKGAKEYALVDNTQTIGGHRIVAPWDPYRK